MRKFTHILTAGIVVLSAFAVHADTWTDPNTGYTWTYRIIGDTSEIYNCYYSAAISPEPTGAVAIPFTLGGKPVTSIGEWAFFNCGGLTSVTIPNSVTSIGDYAFNGCSGLTSVMIPGNVTSIGYSPCVLDATLNTVFMSCCSSITNVSYSSIITNISPYAFADCSALISVTIPDSVTSIGNYAFNGCSGLTSVTVPDSVTSIGDYAFNGCSGLTSVMIPGNVTSIGYSPYVFSSCYSSITNVSYSSIITNISPYAFAGCSGLTSVTIPDSVTSIGDYAFDGCNLLLDTTTIPGVQLVDGWAVGNTGSLTGDLDLTGVRGIGNDAFNGCSRLMSVTIPGSVRSIGDDAFHDCSGLTNVTIGVGVTSIGEWAFFLCSGLTSVTIPDSVTAIGEWAFSSCSGLTSVTIPDSVRSIGDDAFHGCSGLTNVTIGVGVTSIGDDAFYFCAGLVEIAVSAGNSAYRSTNGLLLTKDGKTLIRGANGVNGAVTIPDGVTSIEHGAFSGCWFLKSVSMPRSVTCIGAQAFSDCSSLADIVVPDSVTDIGAEAFLRCSGLADENGFVIIRSTLYSYHGHSSSAVIPDGVTSIGKWAFGGCSGLTSVTIPDSVTSVGEWAFSSCIRLTSVTIPDSVTSIGEWAFHNCSGLTSVTIGNGVTSIGDDAFYNCSGLTSVTIPGSVTSIGYSPFYGCSRLKDVTVPQSVLDAQIKNVFSSCYSSITNVSYSSIITNVSPYAFSECSRLTSVAIPGSVTTIGEWAFSGCSRLTSVTIPGSVTNIGYCAFYNCSGLANVTFFGDAPSGISDSYILRNARSVRYPKQYASTYEQFVSASQFGGYIEVGDYLNIHAEIANDENNPWNSDCIVSHDGEASMRSGNIGNEESSWIELTVNGAGRLSFWWKASSEEYDGEVYDYAYLSVDGVPQGSLDLDDYRLNGVAIGGKTEWTNVVINITGDGPHTVRWTYCKDDVDESDVGEDCVWLDEVLFAPYVSLSYILDGGEGSVPAPAQYYAGDLVTLPTGEGLSWVDHVFDGWSDGNADYASGASYTVPASNVTLTAKWIAKRFLTFTLDGGDGEIPATIKDVPGATVMLPVSDGLSKPKHRFVGWSDGVRTYDAGSGYVVTNSDVEFTAAWAANTLSAPTITSADVANGGVIETEGATINITAGSGTVIYYTLDGTVPTTGSTRYTVPFSANGMYMWIRAIAVKDNYFDSPVAEFFFTRKPYSAAECLNAEGTFATGGSDAAWGRVLGAAAHDGVAAMRSGAIGDGETSSIEMTVVGVGEIGFWWKSSSEISRNRKYDYVSFLIDGVEKSWLGGMKDWTNEVFRVNESGPHTFTWVYQKNDNGLTQGEDCAWLDEVIWSSGYVVDASVTGDKTIRVNEEWVTTELDRRFGAGKKEAFIAKFGSDIAAALTKKTGKFDGAGNELAVWHDYVAGTDPTDTNSTFKAKIEIRDGVPVIEWEPNLNEGGEVRIYTIYGKAELKDEWHSPTNALDHFFKVDVSMPVDGTVTFNGGGGAAIAPVVVRVGQPIGTLPTPTWQGYDFLGWFTETEGGMAITPETIVTDDLTIYAHWERHVAADLVHRWSFNGDLTDSVGGQTATAIGNVTTDGQQYSTTGGSSGTCYIDLGDWILPTNDLPVTVEMWVTRDVNVSYGRIFAWGSMPEGSSLSTRNISHYATDHIQMSWDGACRLTSSDINLGEFSVGVKYHIAAVYQPTASGIWKATFYKQDPVTGETISTVSGDMNEGWSIKSIKQTEMILAHALTTWDSCAKNSYDEIRIWNKAMTESELTASAIAGPDADL